MPKLQPKQPASATNVVNDLKQLDGGGGQQIEKVPAEEGNSVVGDNLNIGRLGMGGLKALEKINNLIKASAESQEGDDSVGDNGLTDEQAQAIERMIIEGIHHIKKKAPTPGTQRASIPRQRNQQNKIVKAFSKVAQGEKRKGATVPQPRKIAAQKKETTTLPTPVQVGVPKLQKQDSNDMGASSQNRSEHNPTESPTKTGPAPVLKSPFIVERKTSHPGKLRGLGLGNAGAGNSP